jgi:hypothetical protein
MAIDVDCQGRMVDFVEHRLHERVSPIFGVGDRERRARETNLHRGRNPKHVELIACPVLKHMPSDMSVFHNSAAECERCDMKTASSEEPDGGREGA